MGFKILIYDLVESTFEIARRFQSVEEFTTILAKEQLRGRGRFNREWLSPRGGLWFTTLLYPRTPAHTYNILSLLSSLSVLEAIRENTGLKPNIRWPNDLYLNNKKIAGVLIESEINEEIIERSLVGIGVNVNFRLEHLPLELRDKATTLLEEYGKHVDEDTLLIEILSILKEYYEKYKGGLYSEIMKYIKKEADFISKNVLLYTRSGKIKAFIRDLDIYGNLIIEIADETLTLTPKDVEKMEVVEK